MFWRQNRKAGIAFCIGSMCAVSYYVVYIARNILGTVSPQMIESGAYTTEYIGLVSSLNMGFYAVGQLINGILGDRVKARYMMCGGMILAGIANFLFPFMTARPDAALIVYGISGFFLAMIYGPMTKLVAENTDPVYTTRCSLGYTMLPALSAPTAGILAVYFVWEDTFGIAGVLLCAVGVISLLCFLFMEKRGIIKYNQYLRKEREGFGIKVLLERRIVLFTLIAVLTGIVRTSVSFWLPTYFLQYLQYTSEQAAVIFTVTSIIMAPSGFLTVFIYERLKSNMDLLIRIMFGAAFVLFLLLYFVKLPLMNIILIEAALFANGSVATMMYSRYCPSLYDTGLVSSATGFLDFMSYAAAAVSSALFANAVSDIGWQNLILVWAGLMGVGTLLVLLYDRIPRTGCWKK